MSTLEAKVKSVKSQQNSKYSIDNLPPFMDHWKQAVEGGATPEQIAENCYHPNALLKGTIVDETVQGTEDITSYFHKFSQDKNDIKVTFNTMFVSPSDHSYTGEYTFDWTDDAGNTQSQKANYTYESVMNDDLTEVIGTHHSSRYESEVSP